MLSLVLGSKKNGSSVWLPGVLSESGKDYVFGLRPTLEKHNVAVPQLKELDGGATHVYQVQLVMAPRMGTCPIRTRYSIKVIVVSIRHQN